MPVVVLTLVVVENLVLDLAGTCAMTHDQFVRRALARTRTMVVTIPTVFAPGTTDAVRSLS